MKGRYGFISNSSSSSFIAAAKKGNTKVKITIEIDIDKFAEHRFKNEKELLKYVKAEYLEKEDFPEYDRCVELMNEGKTIYFGSFSSDSDEPIEQFLCECGIPEDAETEDFKIIQSEGGY